MNKGDQQENWDFVNKIDKFLEERAKQVELHKTAPETRQMISELDKRISLTKQAMENLSKQVEDGFKKNSEEHREIIDEFKEEIKVLIDKKADKWVEWAVKYGGGIIISLILGALGFLIRETLYK